MKFVVRKGSLYLVLIVTALLVLSDSLDALMRGKDAAIFRQFADASPEISAADYVALISISLIINTLIPVTYAIYQYFSLRFAGQSSLARAVWGILLIGALAMRLLGINLSSLFAILSSVCLAVLFIHHILMKSAVNRERSSTR
ncbi:MAG TPA: hypothetical protein GXZ64_02475 [Clostridiaceae bacterium]|jgi:hypothetical protein|nr:hypothetical protein [Clostridiaceae bacterium]